VAGTKSYNAQNDTLEKSWFIVDGEDQIVGRIASDIAVVLMGKHRPNYTPNIDTGDFVVLVNCDKVKFSGNKLNQKTYTWYTGYTGLRSESAGNRLNRKPEQVMRDAVRRMLPKNKLGRQMLSKLKIYKGSEHPHQAQDPQPLTGGRTLK
jgi:large subunit ribosomal protein L13